MPRQGLFEFGFVRRAPYVSAAVLFLWLLIVWNAGRRAFASDAGSAPGWDWLVLGYAVWTVIGFIWLPRALRHARETKPMAKVPAFEVVRFALAPAVFLIAFSAVALGADGWTMTIGLVLSGVLLLANARATAASE